jgi:hypothetical protein
MLCSCHTTNRHNRGNSSQGVGCIRGGFQGGAAARQCRQRARAGLRRPAPLVVRPGTPPSRWPRACRWWRTCVSREACCAAGAGWNKRRDTEAHAPARTHAHGPEAVRSLGDGEILAGGKAVPVSVASSHSEACTEHRGETHLRRRNPSRHSTGPPLRLRRDRSICQRARTSPPLDFVSRPTVVSPAAHDSLSTASVSARKERGAAPHAHTVGKKEHQWRQQPRKRQRRNIHLAHRELPAGPGCGVSTG